MWVPLRVLLSFVDPTTSTHSTQQARQVRSQANQPVRWPSVSSRSADVCPCTMRNSASRARRWAFDDSIIATPPDAAMSAVDARWLSSTQPPESPYVQESCSRQPRDPQPRDRPPRTRAHGDPQLPAELPRNLRHLG